MARKLDPIIRAVATRIAEKSRVILAMDGMAAAGKTTAAETLAALWQAPVVHMDDFFLPAALRTPERLAQPGGNVHYERFKSEVLPALATGEAFSYRPFLCSAMAYGESIYIPAAAVIIVEGAYALHPVLGPYADVTAFFSVSPPEQERRIRARSGSRWEDFRTRWIPMEAAYHRAFSIPEKADIIIQI